MHDEAHIPPKVREEIAYTVKRQRYAQRDILPAQDKTYKLTPETSLLPWLGEETT